MAIVRIEGRLVDHRQHFAGAHVHHHDRAGARAVVADRRLELAVGQVLDAQVDAELQFAPRAHRADALDVLDAIPLAVLDDALGAVLAPQPVVEGEFGALLPGVVDVGEAEQVPGHFAGRVVAAVLAREVDAVDLERAHLARIRRLQPARQVHELAILLGADAPDQIVQVDVDGLRQARQLFGVGGELARVDPHRIDRRADRERLAVPIGDRAAMRDDRRHAREAGRALAGEEAMLDQLQLHRAPDQRRADRQHHEQTPGPGACETKSAARFDPDAPECLCATSPGGSWRGNLDVAANWGCASAAWCWRRSRRRRRWTRSSARSAAGPTPPRVHRARNSGARARRTIRARDACSRSRRWPSQHAHPQQRHADPHQRARQALTPPPDR